MKKSETEAIEILLKNIINMHEKLNILIDYLANKNIHTSVHFKPLHKYQIIKDIYK